jgi:hypothetical protein
MRVRALVIAITLGMCGLAACSSYGNSTPAPPKALATPKSVDEITGIWRTVRQNTLELRKAGTFALISPVADAMGGNYVLEQDQITFSDTKGCGSADGVYRIQVSSKDRMVLDQASDACNSRRTALTSDPFVYAQPDFS